MFKSDNIEICLECHVYILVWKFGLKVEDEKWIMSYKLSGNHFIYFSCIMLLKKYNFSLDHMVHNQILCHCFLYSNHLSYRTKYLRAIVIYILYYKLFLALWCTLKKYFSRPIKACRNHQTRGRQINMYKEMPWVRCNEQRTSTSRVIYN